MRVDKFLKVSRLVKRRTVAREACEEGRVAVNGRKAKPGSEVSVGDIVAIEFGGGTVQVQVLEVRDSATADIARRMYRVVEGPVRGISPADEHTY
ncbi:MAG: RNA-binding S4 domain-containing protein [Firmicutes bacterium]|jgi:ribosomal 50S subunit-recycling heat shock protein|nr:RNA-binding S4 domain-containing protein [Bacillota bacterium]